MLGWLRDGLRDFSISRSGTTWGIPFPGDEKHRIYVWFDALTNYLTGAGFPDDAAAFEKWWPADLHVIGKNITRFHCLYWPAMLMSAGLPLPKQVFAHGFMLDRGERMSKTTGNTEDPDEAADTFGIDGVRYVVLREVPVRPGCRRHLGRPGAALQRRPGQRPRQPRQPHGEHEQSIPGRQRFRRWPMRPDRLTTRSARPRERTVDAYHAAMTRYHLDEALAAIMSLAGAVNGYAEGQAPWSLNKAGETVRVGQVLAVMAEACRILGHLLAPVAPSGARAIHDQLGVPPPYDERGAGGPGLDELLAWGAAGEGLATGSPTPIFPRIEVEATV